MSGHILYIGRNVLDLLLSSQILKSTLGSRTWYANWTHISIFMIGYARLAWPTILVGLAKQALFKSPTPLFQYDNLIIKKKLVTLCISSPTHVLVNSMGAWCHGFTNYGNKGAQCDFTFELILELIVESPKVGTNSSFLMESPICATFNTS